MFKNQWKIKYMPERGKLTTTDSPWAVSVHVSRLQSGSAWQQNASDGYEDSGQGQYQQLHTTTNTQNIINHTTKIPNIYKFCIHGFILHQWFWTISLQKLPAWNTTEPKGIKKYKNMMVHTKISFKNLDLTPFLHNLLEIFYISYHKLNEYLFWDYLTRVIQNIRLGKILKKAIILYFKALPPDTHLGRLGKVLQNAMKHVSGLISWIHSALITAHYTPY